MKIGIIHPNLDIVGGAEQTTISLLNALTKTNHNITLYTTTKSINIPHKIKICHINKNSFPIGWNLQRLLDIKKTNIKNENTIKVASPRFVPKDDSLVVWQSTARRPDCQTMLATLGSFTCDVGHTRILHI